MACLRTGQVKVEVLQREGKVAIDPFRPSAELRPLQPLDDQPKPLNVGLRLGKLGLVTSRCNASTSEGRVARLMFTLRF
jgi:hypothetical protein